MVVQEARSQTDAASRCNIFRQLEQNHTMENVIYN